MAEPLASTDVGYEVLEQEPPELMGRNLRAGTYLFAGGTAFFFLCFLFAFFYLRSLDNAGMWKPKGIDASIAWGTVVLALYVASALLVRLGHADHVAERRSQWRLKGALALALGIAGLVVQAIGWSHQGFGPADGGFASVYFGWTAFLFLFVFGTMYWLETVLATSLRYRNAAAPGPGHASGDPHRTEHDIADPLSLVRAQLEALSFYWTFLAGIAVLAWVLLYLL
ncbi:MAG TPA: cytochrome c oxidase subunit 3 [Gaiellaceae bacterium]|nr:cytochrome c oxidase subunit 3 [Gaiellaceae bacterium]